MSYYSLQGTKGSYEAPRGLGDDHKVWFKNLDQDEDNTKWTPLENYLEHLPDRYKNATEKQKKAGHWGGDFFIVQDFVDAIINDVKPAIDIYDACEWTAVGILSEISIMNDGKPVLMPDFRGDTPVSEQVVKFYKFQEVYIIGNNEVEHLDQSKKPQLVMFREQLDDLAPLDLAEDYTLRHFQPGDEQFWEEIINKSFEKQDTNFKENIASHGIYKPERVLFICYKGKPVATATAWYNKRWHQETGYLHMVGVIPGKRGKGLGLKVSLAVLHQMVEEGRTSAVLETDDFRLPAIKTYIKLGFKPQIIHENQVARWRGILTKLGEKWLAAS